MLSIAFLSKSIGALRFLVALLFACPQHVDRFSSVSGSYSASLVGTKMEIFVFSAKLTKLSTI